MTFTEWIQRFPPKKQLEIWKQLAPFLSVRELKNVMTRVGAGEELLIIHQDMGLLEKYQVELFRILNNMGTPGSSPRGGESAGPLFDTD